MATEKDIRDALREFADLAPLTSSFDPQGRHAVPPRRRRLLAPLLAAAAVAAVAVGIGVGVGMSGHHPDAAGPAGPTATASIPATASVTESAAPLSSPSSAAGGTVHAPAAAVHLSSLQADGTTWGIGMPIILFATPAPTDSSEFTKNVTVTVNGEPADGAWYWSQPSAQEKKTGTYEAHYRPKTYWPPNSDVQVRLDLAGRSAGKGLEYDGKLTSVNFRIGDAHRSVVDASAKTMTVYDDNKVMKRFEVSLGKASTPTYNGTKVVMQKGEDSPDGRPKPQGTVQMIGPGYNEAVQWSVRLTNSGEYVHAAPWNSNIGRLSTSNGCTNLDTTDAKWFYNFSLVGDVIEYAGTDGGKMPSWDGYGDWNVPWSQWRQGGLLPS